MSSLAASTWSGGGMAKGGEWKGLGGTWARGDFGTIAFGTVSGGAGAALSGGNFWQGAATGLTVSMLNHAVHRNDPPKKDWGSYFKKMSEDFIYFTADCTEIPLVLNRSVISNNSTGWLDAKADSVALTITAGGALGSLSVGFKLGEYASVIVGMASAYGNSYTAQFRVSYANVETKLWYGKYKYNIFTGEIKSVETVKIITNNYNVGYKYESRVVHDLSGKSFLNRSHNLSTNFQNLYINNNLPKVGGNVYN